MSSSEISSPLDTDTETASPSSQQLSRTSKRTAASTWEHARLPQGDEPEREGRLRIFYCKYCPSYQCKSTTAARHHLTSKHDITFEAGVGDRQIKALSIKKLDQIYDKAGLVKKEFKDEVLKDVLNKRLFDEALVALVVKRNLSFRAVEWPELHALLKVANPTIDREVISSHSTMAKMIHASWASSKDLVRQRLQASLSKIHFSADIWESPNRISFLGICVRFVDRESQKLSNALIGLRPVLSHRADDQVAEIFPLFQDFGITRKIGYFVGDNISSNDVLCRILSASLQDEGVSWDPTHHRTRCNGHIINLAVQAFFIGDNKKGNTEEVEADPKARGNRWRRLGPHGKLHNIAVHIRASSSRSAEFKALAKRGLPLDNETRWNSWYTMLRVALKIAPAIDAYAKKWRVDLNDDYLSPDDWELLQKIMLFLQPFYRATMETQGHNATIDLVLWTMDILVDHFETSMALYASNTWLCNRISKSWEVFDKYYNKTDETSVYAMAIILHPARRTHYIRKFWKKQWQKPALLGAKKLWEKYRDKGVLDLAAVIPDDLVPDVDTLELDEFDRIAKSRELVSNQVGDEYEAYIKAEPVKISGSALNWWLADERRKTWPRLSQLAIDVLSIPAMSDDPERVFSDTRRTISWERMSLGAEVIEHGECLKSWDSAGLLTMIVDGVDDVVEGGSVDDSD